MSNDFSNARVGDKVYSVAHGEGVITVIELEEDFPIRAKFTGGTSTFSFSGRLNVGCPPSLFWGKPEIIAPPKPPRTIKIGDVEVPEPERVAPNKGTDFWVADPCSQYHTIAREWTNSSKDMLWLSRGRVHLSPAAAIAHTEAEILATGGTI